MSDEPEAGEEVAKTLERLVGERGKARNERELLALAMKLVEAGKRHPRSRAALTAKFFAAELISRGGPPLSWEVRENTRLTLKSISSGYPGTIEGALSAYALANMAEADAFVAQDMAGAAATRRQMPAALERALPLAAAMDRETSELAIAFRKMYVAKGYDPLLVTCLWLELAVVRLDMGEPAKAEAICRDVLANCASASFKRMASDILRMVPQRRGQGSNGSPQEPPRETKACPSKEAEKQPSTAHLANDGRADSEGRTEGSTAIPKSVLAAIVLGTILVLLLLTIRHRRHRRVH